VTRHAALFLLTALAVPAVAADPLPVAPPPREVRTDGSRDPAPDAAPAEDPEAVVNRIIANAQQVGEKLAAADAGDATRATQGTILKDIDALLNPPDSPPKGGNSDAMNKQDKNDGKGENDKQNDKKNDGMGNDPKEKKGDGQGNDAKEKKSDGMGKGGADPKGGMNPGGMGQPMDGQANGPRRPRAGAKDPGAAASAAKAGGKEPMPMPAAPGMATAKAEPKDPKSGGAVDGTSDRPPPPLAPQVPLADEVAKEVWGHLPERLRQQMSQYYREEFMPRYAGLLKQYYSSLASSPNGTAPPAPR
jgi:hypothetical protein